MSDVFISYAREDSAQAERIARGLEAAGLTAFWDNEIPPGQTWADYIETKLNQCSAAVVLWSEHSTKSQWVREEARMGRSKLIPAKLDASEPPFGFGDVQAADLSSWGGDYNHPQWARFVNAVIAKARPDGAPAAASQPQAPMQHQPQPQAGGWQASPQQQQTAWQTPPPRQQQWSGGQSAGPGGETLSPVGYVQKCLRLYVDGKGRARRSEYGWFVLASYVVVVVAVIIDASIFGFNSYTGQLNGALATLLCLGLVPPLLSAASRRAHDIGQSGWLAALTCIPYLGFIATLGLIFVPGQTGPNSYGPDPKAQ